MRPRLPLLDTLRASLFRFCADDVDLRTEVLRSALLGMVAATLWAWWWEPTLTVYAAVSGLGAGSIIGLLLWCTDKARSDDEIIPPPDEPE